MEGMKKTALTKTMETVEDQFKNVSPGVSHGVSYGMRPKRPITLPAKSRRVPAKSRHRPKRSKKGSPSLPAPKEKPVVFVSNIRQNPFKKKR